MEGWYLSSKERIEYNAPSEEELTSMDTEFFNINEQMRRMGEVLHFSLHILKTIQQTTCMPVLVKQQVVDGAVLPRTTSKPLGQ